MWVCQFSQADVSWSKIKITSSSRSDGKLFCVFIAMKAKINFSKAIFFSLSRLYCPTLPFKILIAWIIDKERFPVLIFYFLPFKSVCNLHEFLFLRPFIDESQGMEIISFYLFIGRRLNELFASEYIKIDQKDVFFDLLQWFVNWVKQSLNWKWSQIDLSASYKTDWNNNNKNAENFSNFY